MTAQSSSPDYSRKFVLGFTGSAGAFAASTVTREFTTEQTAPNHVADYGSVVGAAGIAITVAYVALRELVNVLKRAVKITVVVHADTIGKN